MGLFDAKRVVCFGLMGLAAIFMSCKIGGEAKLLAGAYSESGSKSGYLGGKYSQRFEYDEQNRITAIYLTSYLDDGDDEERERTSAQFITYNDDGSVIVEGGETSGLVIKFVKSGNTVIEEIIDGFEISEDDDGRDTLTLNRDGLIEKEGYTYKNGNLMRISYDDNAGNDYKYDKKKSPYANSKTPKWLIQRLFGDMSAARNNVTQNYYSGGEISGSYNYEYEYDKDGLPTKQTETWYSDGNEDTMVVHYTYSSKTKGTETKGNDNVKPKKESAPSENEESAIENDADTGGGTGVKLVKSIMTGESGFRFDYDEQNRIVGLYNVDGPTRTVMYDVMYEDSSITLQRSEDGGDKTVFSIKGNIVKALKSTLIINDDGCIVSLKDDGRTGCEHDEKNDVFKRTMFEEKYEYEDKNLTLTSDNQGDCQTSNENFTRYLEYDGKKSPFVNCATPKWFLQFLFQYHNGQSYASKNNIVETYSFGSNKEAKIFYEYKYDADGFPTKRTAQNSDESEQVVRFTYTGGTAAIIGEFSSAGESDDSN